MTVSFPCKSAVILHIPAALFASQSVRHKIPPNRCGYYFFDKYSVIHSCITAATVTPCSAAYIFKNCLSSTVTDRFNVVRFSDPRIFLIPFSVSNIDNTSCHNISNCANTQFILSFFLTRSTLRSASFPYLRIFSPPSLHYSGLSLPVSVNNENSITVFESEIIHVFFKSVLRCQTCIRQISRFGFPFF